jgi:hypothetical protein
VSAAIRARPSPAARIGRLIEIVLIFVVLGPPIGGFVLFLLTAASTGNPHTLVDLLNVPFFVLGAAIFSYPFGAAPAALAGLAIGIKQAFFGRTTWPMALAVGLIASPVFLEGFYSFYPRLGVRAQGFNALPSPEFSAILILTCLVPTMLCWTLVRSPYFAPPSCTDAAP